MTATIDAPTTPATPAVASARGSSARAYLVVVGVGALVVAAAALLSLAVGAVALSPGEVLRSLFGSAGQSTDALVDARVQRTLVGILIGGSVAVSGAVMQGVTRNPLADPGILGVNSGAALAVILGIYWAGISTLPAYIWLAVLGGSVAAVAVYAIASLGPRASQPVTMALAGAAVTAAASSIIAGIMVTSDEVLDTFRFWQVGSVAGRDVDAIVPVLPMFLVGLLLCLASGPILNALALGDDMASALGQRVRLGRLVASFGAVLLCAGATAVAGPIGFVGLVVPHVVRLVVGPDYRRVLVGSMFGGPALLLLADTVGRVVAPPAEISVGIVTALIGAPALIWLVRRVRTS
ncbi:iron complex transport system permease protein [Barrientosiimonas humi]|uniref:Iron complex transport system permease protein n=2 Tax=Barrientosiimonas TaxID=1535207 RepID=A0A542XFM9_9MICO|nr:MULTISPECIES: iron ABC transporter permease [Barrientosiimonas]TQL34627.1 iron complex transport system permease protein [Barrientosiimonas humi]BDZ59737.1 ABC transporter permease [Barrientosiimonas endolithica]CAG7574617.1 putative siderophore transport system permease protein YfiZ [Barrientosiimonas humi]